MTDRVSPQELARVLGLDDPTGEQSAVISAPLQPALVIAGAGSGKTATMANRVLWLLANGHVQPGEILGLTFTRKAAGELAERISRRIADLRRAELLPGEHDLLEEPLVSTYNAYANGLYLEQAYLLGQDAEGTVLGEAGAWQLARSVVVRSEQEGLGRVDRSMDDVVGGVLNLSRAAAENLTDLADVQEFAARFRTLADLEPGGTKRWPFADTKRHDDLLALIERVGSLDVLAELAREFRAEKAGRGLIEFSDQVAYALEVIRRRPEVAEHERTKYKVVLLDEYQDTSVVQTRLLAELFRDHPVMAVGDPNQSIYGWRGASAENLAAFGDQFGSDRTYSLSVSWRNGRSILAAANRLVEPFAQAAAAASRPMKSLSPRPGAEDRRVQCAYLETIHEEAQHVAQWLAGRLAEPGPIDRVTGRPRERTAALLLRARKNQPYFLAALREAGVRYHVLGVGGLLAEPEIADLVCALAVVSDPDAGVELVRLLTGPRWRIGVADLAALRGVADKLASDGVSAASRVAGEATDAAESEPGADDELAAEAPAEVADRVRAALRSSLSDSDRGSLVDALDFLTRARDDGPYTQAFGPDSLARLRDAGRFFANLRLHGGLELRDFTTLVAAELELELEVAANEARYAGTAPMDAFHDALDSYLALEPAASVRGFLAWLRLAEQREDLSPRPEDPEPGTVQVLTIHGAKGLEWDAVAVPRLVDKELPALPVGGKVAWLKLGELPWEFRGDAAHLPQLDWAGPVTASELHKAIEAFKDRVGEHYDQEERRLAYVAVTRAREDLLLTGSFWSALKSARKPSPFLTELELAGLIDPLPDAPLNDENPLGDHVDVMSWPLDPLGGRRAAVEEAARLVEAAEPALAEPWRAELELLLAERDERAAGPGPVALPPRVPASRFKDYLADPEGVTQSLRRPMPERPYRAAVLGTLFHAWVEERFGVSGTGELDALGYESDLDLDLDLEETGGSPGATPAQPGAADEAALAALKATFERSRWAALAPVEVEREIHLPFAGRTVVCKIDAVYPLAGDRFEIVDWKTGKRPADDAELEQRQLQLALYRVAYARWAGIDPDRVDAVFYYVADDQELRPDRIFDEAELLERWTAVYGS